MKQLFLRMLFALDPKAGGAADVQPIAETSEILDNFELPKRAGGGTRGSKYVDEGIAAKIEKMQPKQGILIPLMDGVLPKRHRYALAWRINEWAKTQAVEEVKEGDKVVKAAVPAPKFSVAVLNKDGKDIAIGVRRDS